MKKLGLILPLITVILMCAGCKKTKVQVTIAVTGKWKLAATKGGGNGAVLTIPAYVVTYTLNADSTYSQSPANRKGIFHVTLQQSMFSGSPEHYIYFSNNDDAPGLVALKNDTLIISDNHVNPVSRFYARVK